MTTLVDSEDHADAVMMGYDGPTNWGDLVRLIREHGGFTVVSQSHAIQLGEMQAEYIALAILKSLGKSVS